MKKFVEPEIEIVKFSMVDVITTSNEWETIPGEDVTPWG